MTETRNESVTWLTQEAYDRLKAEYDYLSVQGRIGIAKKIEAARDEGFALMRLDTGTRFTEALQMYRAIGFRECPPYYDYPASVLPQVVFMQLPLTWA